MHIHVHIKERRGPDSNMGTSQGCPLSPCMYHGTILSHLGTGLIDSKGLLMDATCIMPPGCVVSCAAVRKSLCTRSVHQRLRSCLCS